MTESTYKLDDWVFRAKEETEWLPAQVPGCVHTDLYTNKRIQDPFYGTNERDLQWIDKKDWEYKTSFNVTEALLKESKIELVFEGLDTYADVSLNGHHVLSADNMFRSWKVDVTSLLKETENILKVYFHSPINIGLEKLEELGYGLPATNDVSEIGGLGDRKVSVFTRKAPYHFGWDWGPRFVTSGIWKTVYLNGWTKARITDVFLEQNHVSASQAELTAKVEIEAEQAYTGMLHLEADGIFVEKEVQLRAGLNVIEGNVDLQNPKLWWSRGLGEPHLYKFTARFLLEEKVVDEKSVKTGLRQIRLVRDRDESGSTFYFELNGVPVFAKGANHIPNDSFLTDLNFERYKYEIQSAAEANMNMIRVWGGGIYEYDGFYDLCDEYGILVWQDFMFACSMYPGDAAFLENVRKEAIENVKRLRHHPSIVLWCGNNEMDVAWSHYVEEAGWGWKQLYTPDQREKIWGDYEILFHKSLPKVLAEHLRDVPYWPSSPMSHWSNDARQHANAVEPYGDSHYWGVWHALEPFENYKVKIGRFMSEYGFQSFPEEKTVRTYAVEKDMALESDVMLAHQKNGRGNAIIRDYMEKYFPTPKDFPSFLYMSQVQQAEAMKSAIEAHRRKKPYCMGTLYWQLNDCWPVASWSGIDYYGRWKALHYYAKKSFKDVLLSIDASSEHVHIYLVSDKQEEGTGNLTVKLLDFNGNVLNEWKKPGDVKGNSADLVWSMEEIILLNGYERRSALLYAVLGNEQEILDTKMHYFTSSKELDLQQPSIKVKKVQGTKGTQFVLETDVLAKQVCLSSENDGVFSDNFFDLIPGFPQVVTFYKSEPQVKAFAPAQPGILTVKSMVDFVDGNQI